MQKSAYRNPVFQCDSIGIVTIQLTPKRSVTMPKQGDQNVFPIGIPILPPSAKAVNALRASASVGTVSESVTPLMRVLSSQPSDAMTTASPMRNEACITL